MIKDKLLITLLFVGSWVLISAQVNLNRGLIASYPFNGNANDVSINGNDARVTNATLTTDRFGNENSAYYFDGDSSYIVTPINSGFTNQMTMCAWFKTSYNNFGGILSSRYAGGVSTDLTTNDAGMPFVHFSDGNEANMNNTFLKGSINCNDDSWHFLVGTYDSLNLKLYVDGTLLLQKYAVFNLFVDNPFIIGYDNLSGYNRYFDGKIDDVRIYNRALTADEVSSLFTISDCVPAVQNDTTVVYVSNSEFNKLNSIYEFFRTDTLTTIGECDSIIFRYNKFEYDPSLDSNNTIQNGVIACYLFNGNANDTSGNGNNGIVVNATLTTDRFGKENSAYIFNGYNSYITTPVSTGFTTGISLCSWFKTSYNNNSGIISSRNTLDVYTGITTGSYGEAKWFITDGNPSHLKNSVLLTEGVNYNDDNWHFLVGTYDGTAMKLYVDGMLQTQKDTTLNLFIQDPFLVGWDNLPGYNRYFDGKIDDVRIYNRALTADEVSSLFTISDCVPTIQNDTTTYYVSSPEFQHISPVYKFIKTDSLKISWGNCDSIINHYAKFEYNPQVFSDTISVSDTLIINLSTSETNSNSINTIMIFPNPARNHLYINYGNYTDLSGYLIAIRNELGNVIYFSSITQSVDEIDISSWTKGIYFVQLFNKNSEMIETRKIIIQ